MGHVENRPRRRDRRAYDRIRMNRTRLKRSQHKTISQRVAIDKSDAFFLYVMLFSRNFAVITNNRRIFARITTYRSHVHVCPTNERTRENCSLYGATIVYAGVFNYSLRIEYL